MTGFFCNFKQQKMKMTQMFIVDNYVEIGDFLKNRMDKKYIGVIVEMQQILHRYRSEKTIMLTFEWEK